MSKELPRILIKYRNKSRKNHQISTQINSILQTAMSDFRDAFPEFCDPDLDPYLCVCLEETWEKLSKICEMFDIAASNRESDYLGFEQLVKEYQESY